MDREPTLSKTIYITETKARKEHVHLISLKRDSRDFSKINFLEYLELQAWMEVHNTQKYFPTGYKQLEWDDL